MARNIPYLKQQYSLDKVKSEKRDQSVENKERNTSNKIDIT